MRRRKAIVEPSQALEHLVFATLGPDFSCHFALDAGDMIEIVPMIAGLELDTRRAEIARSLVFPKSAHKIAVDLISN